jgi:hypothetical protein
MIPVQTTPAKTVTAQVEYEVNGTVHMETFAGWRVSTQIFADGRAVIIVYDENLRKVRTWQCISVQTINKLYSYT